MVDDADGQSSAERWHAVETGVALDRLASDPRDGLDAGEAARRLDRYGPNRLIETGRTRWPRLLGRQFLDPLVIILLAAAAVSFAAAEPGDTMTILAIVVLNATLGFVQEWKAERAIEALRRMLSPRCRVVRGGASHEVDAADLVPGDLVLIEAGDRVPADLRLVAATDLRVDESALTGESASVAKQTPAVAADAPLAERASMAWTGTAATYGSARGLVVTTGMDTEFGRIAGMTRDVEDTATPLQRKLAGLGRLLGLLSIAVSVVVALAGWLTGKSLLEMFHTAISLAVAVVPEGLPAVVTLTLALGIRSLVRRRALLRTLASAEALGSATVICTDKTGTLTENEMTVQRIWLASGEIEVEGAGYDPLGDLTRDGSGLDPADHPDLAALLESGVLCNHADIECVEDDWRPLGDPTEVALVVAARKAGVEPARDDEPIELPFDSERKRMTVLSEDEGTATAHVKGAPEEILERCGLLMDGESERDLSDADRTRVEEAFESFARRGLRTLAVARRRLDPAALPVSGAKLDPESIERDLTLLGVFGIIDPPRDEVPEAIALARAAGIRVLVITGDNATTATAIAKQIGLNPSAVLSGSDLDRMKDEELERVVGEDPLFARTAPEHKLRIVRALQSRGEIVGMTGDGVNDAPALRKADIGIAMGQRGTDVAKGASDIILTDDNFASIVGAVEEGRRQYDNIQKFVRYLLSSNFGEVVAIFTNILLGGPLILLPVQILWMNLVTDGLTALAIGIEPVEKGTMRRPPRDPAQPILGRAGLLRIGGLGAYLGLATLAMFWLHLGDGSAAAIAHAQTIAFTGIILLEKANVFNFRSLSASLRTVGFFTNPWILAAVGGSIALQAAAVYVPFLQDALHTVPLAATDWLVMLAFAVPVLAVPEIARRMHESRS